MTQDELDNDPYYQEMQDDIDLHWWQTLEDELQQDEEAA